MKKSIIKAFLLVLLGIIMSVAIQDYSHKIQQRQLTNRYEIVVAPTRKSQVNYAEDHAAYSFDNPKKKLCVVIYDHKEGFLGLYEITPAYQ